MNNLKKSDAQKIKLTIANNIISSVDNDEECVMHSKSDNIEVMINEADKDSFDTLKNSYENNLESIKGCDFVFNYCL